MRFIKEIETFWTLFTAPTVWALHFLVCYVAFAVYCAKQGRWRSPSTRCGSGWPS